MSLPPPPALPTTTAQLGDRTLFPDLQWPIHANHAAVSPLSQPVVQMATAQLRDVASQGAAAYGRWIAQRERLRASLAAFVGAAPADIALTTNTSAGVTAIALSQPWPNQASILCFRGEFPANVTPWQQVARARGLELTLLDLPEPDAADGHEALLSRVESALQTRAAGPAPVFLVAISAVQFQTGWRAPLGPLAALCHRFGARLGVDAVQAVGCVPLDVRALDIDFLAAGSHKWLMGPDGAGFVYAAPQHMADWQPLTAGWLSHESPADFLFLGPGHLRYDRPIRQRIDLLEAGNVPGASLAGLEAALALLVQLTPEAIFAHVQAWHDAVEPGLLALGFASARSAEVEARSGILSLRPPAGVDAPALQRVLAETGLLCSAPDGWLRLSPHWCSPLSEPATVVAQVAQALARPVP